MDLSKLSSKELRDLQEQLKRELTQREGQDKAKAREQILAIAHSVGIPAKELIGAGGGGRVKAGGERPGIGATRYRNPADDSQQWTGRGRQPKWVKEWLAAGKDLAALKV